MLKLLTRWVFLAVLIIVIVFSMVGCGSVGSNAKSERDYYKVGVITSLSGANVFGGTLTKRGYEMWAETVNKKGGIKVGDKSYEVKLVYADDQSDPNAGANAVERMITSEKVDFILGPYSSGSTMAVAPILEKYKVPMITGSAESPQIWKQKFKYTFGTIPAVNLTGPTPLNTLLNDVKPAPKTIAIIGINDTFSKSVAEAFKATAEKGGMNILKYDLIPEGSDFTPIISAIKALNPDVLAVGGHEKVHMEIIKDCKSLNFMPKAFVMHYGITTPDFIRGLGNDANYVFGMADWTPSLKYKDDLFGTNNEYVEASKAKYGGTVPDYGETGSAAAGEVFGAAIAKLGAPPPLSEEQRTKLVSILEEINVNTFFGPVKFATEGDWYHDNIGLKGLSIQIMNGEQTIVGPKDLKEKDPIYPVPAFNAR